MWARAPSCQASITHSVQETETMPVISVILKFSFLISGVRSGGFDPSHSYAAERFPMMHWACLLCVTALHFTNFVSSLLVEFVLLPLCQMSLTLHCACLIFWSDLTMFIVHLFLLLIVYFSHCSLFFSSFTPTDGKPWAWRFLPVRLELLSPLHCQCLFQGFLSVLQGLELNECVRLSVFLFLFF